MAIAWEMAIQLNCLWRALSKAFGAELGCRDQRWVKKQVIRFAMREQLASSKDCCILSRWAMPGNAIALQMTSAFLDSSAISFANMLLTLISLENNVSKTVVLDFAGGRVSGVSRWGCGYQPGAKYLGTFLHVSQGQCKKAREHTKAVVSNVLKRVERVAALPSGDALKTHLLQSTAVSPLHHDAFGSGSRALAK
eukprot:3684925-Amphidinium_carterae.3